MALISYDNFFVRYFNQLIIENNLGREKRRKVMDQGPDFIKMRVLIGNPDITDAQE